MPGQTWKPFNFRGGPIVMRLGLIMIDDRNKGNYLNFTGTLEAICVFLPDIFTIGSVQL